MNFVQQIIEENKYFENAKHLVDVEGMSTPRVCTLLNKLVGHMEEKQTYLEIGTWKGLTICSAAIHNQGKNCVACDKFRFHGKFTGWGFKAKRALYDNLNRYESESAKVTFHHMRSEEMFRKNLVPDNIGVYFYDGDHSYKATRDHILAVNTLLADEAVILVDDWNDPAIQKATRDAIEEMDFEIEWEIELDGNQTQEGWWNGLGVFLLQRS